MSGNAKVLVSKDKVLRCGKYTAEVMAKPTNECSYLRSPMLKLIVGGEEATPVQSFFIHKHLLTSPSRFFTKTLEEYTDNDQYSEKAGDAIQGITMKWREDVEGVIKMPVNEPEVFTNYVQLIYTGVLPIRDELKIPERDLDLSVDDAKKPEHDFKKQHMYPAVTQLHQALVKLYIFCDKVQDLEEKRAVLAAVVDAVQIVYDTCYYPSSSIISMVYAGTLSSDLIRAFLVDIYVLCSWSGFAEPKDHSQFPHESLFDVMVGMFKGRTQPTDTSRIGNTQ
jgi:hypothetical protein